MTKQMLRSAVILMAVLLVGCKQAGSPDANTRDSRLPIDAGAPSCSVSPAMTDPPSTTTITVAFDSQVDWSETDDDGAVATFPLGDAALVFTPRETHTVSQSGATSVPYSTASGTEVILLDVSRGNLGFGALFTVQSATSETEFCELDSQGAYDAGRCLPISTQGAASPPRVAFDGTSYVVFQVRGPNMHRWTFDESPQLVAEADVWDSTNIDRGVVDVESSATDDVVATLGFDSTNPICGTVNVHHYNTNGHAVTNILPFDLGASVAYSSDTANGVSLLIDALCVNPMGNECKIVSQVPAYMFAVIPAGGSASSVRVVGIAAHSSLTMFSDGLSTALVAQSSFHSLVLSRYQESGVPDVANVVLPLAYYGTNAELMGVFAGTAMGANDYVIVYTQNSGGPQKRVARFVVN